MVAISRRFGLRVSGLAFSAAVLVAALPAHRAAATDQAAGQPVHKSAVLAPKVSLDPDSPDVVHRFPPTVVHHFP